MKKALVIVESPAKAKTINKFLGSSYTIKSSMGHIRDLPVKKLGIEIEDDFEPQYIIMPEKKKLVNELKKEVEKCDEIYLAPDPDREGEAIAWHLSEIFKPMGKEIFRVSFNEITKSAVQGAFKNPGRIDDLKVSSQQSRRILDRIMGYKISPFLWKKISGGLSAGRVQSVALKLVCEREKLIEEFIPQEYWSISGEFIPDDSKDLTVSAKLEKFEGEKLEVNNEEEAQKILDAINGEKFTISQITSRQTRRKPAPPFITSTLQQAAINRMHWSITKVMKIAQELYEGLDIGSEGTTGLITYMRTDSVRISDMALGEVREYIEKNHGSDYLPKVPNVYKSKKSAQEAHEAIRPTSAFLTPDSLAPYLSREQLMLYTLIWNRFTASQMEKAVLKSSNATIEAKGYQFSAKGLQILFNGFMVLYRQDEDDEDEKMLPPIKKGQNLECTNIDSKQNFTKPLPRFTEASLVKMLEEQGIGRPSTYASIIQTIYSRNYVNKDSGKLVPTELGKIVTDMLTKSFKDIINVEFTAKMEEKLDEIEDGKRKEKKVLAEFYKDFDSALQEAYTNVERVKPPAPQETDENCEKCGKVMVIRSGRRGKFMACSGFPACKNTKPLPTGVNCPEKDCDGTLVQRRSKKGRLFYGCSNYPKCTHITSRLNKAGKKSDAGDKPEENKTAETAAAPQQEAAKE